MARPHDSEKFDPSDAEKRDLVNATVGFEE